MPDHQKTKTSASPCLGDVTSGCAARSLTGRRQRTPDHRLARAFIRNARAFHAMAWTDDDRVAARSAYHNGHIREETLRQFGVSMAGNFVMACWQTSGGSSSGEQVGWKLMRFDQIKDAVISGGNSAAPRDGYRRGDKRMQRIICEL
jgi:hypothetical protein